MARPRVPSVQLIAVALVAAGTVYALAELSIVGRGVADKALLAVGAAVLLHLMLTADPAWLLSAGLASMMFAGHWELIVAAAPIPPHRVLLAAGLVAVMLRMNGRERPRIELRAVHFVLAAAIVYVLVSAVFAGTLGRRDAQFVLLDDFGVLPFLMFLVAPVAFRTERQRLILLGSLVASGLYLVFTALLEKLELYSLVVPSYIGNPFVGNHFGRARGPFAEAGAMGLALFACGIAAAMAVVVWRRPLLRAVAAVVLVLAPVGLLLTVTRSVWLAGIVGTLVALATSAELRRFLVPAAVAGAAAVLIAFAAIPGVAKQASDRQKDKNPVYERQNTAAAGVRMLAERPLVGYGWRRANDSIEPYFRLDPDIPLIGASAGFHNLYLEYGVSLGLLGLAIWLLGGALAVRSALSGRAPPGVRPWQIGLKALLAGWMVVGLTAPLNYVFATVLLWTFAGVASVRDQPERGATTWSRFQGKPRSTSFG